jgi:hypothetical protein
MKVSKKTPKIILLLSLSLLFAILMSFVFAFWSGYPRGGDSIVHSLKIFWVAKYFPHHNWWNVWVAGMPLFQFYPVGPNIIMAFISKIFNLSPEAVLGMTLIASIGLTGFFVGLFVYDYLKSFFTALLVSFITISTPVIWVASVGFGSYIRDIATPFMVASLYFAFKLAHKPKERKYFFALIIFLTLSLSTHVIIGFRAVGLTIILLLFFVKGSREKLLIATKTLLFFILANSYYLVPLLVFSPRSSFTVTDAAFTLDRYRFYGLTEILGTWQGDVLRGGSFLNSTFFVFPLFFLLLLMVFLINRKFLKEKLFWFFTVGTVGFLFFSSVKIYFLQPLYIIGDGTHALFYSAVVFAIISVGLFIGKVLGKLANLASLALVIGLFLWAWVSFSPDLQTWKESIFPRTYVREKDFDLLEVPENSQHRFGTGNDSYLAMNFNRYYPDYPQTRDYFANGVINTDFNFYLTSAVWNWEDNLEETKSLLDWWAVDKFTVEINSDNFDKFSSFNLIGRLSNTVRMFEFEQPSSILSSTNTPTVLFIGEKENYMVFFHALVQANINSQKIIPVYLGRDSLQGIKLDELQKFSAVFIYDTELKDKKDQTVLKKYVEEGGSLFIENRGENPNLPEPFPIRNMKKDEVVGVWDLVKQNYDFGVSFEDFSPPIFEEGPWGVSTAGDLYPWAQVLISESGEPIIVGGELGEGKVAWSGMNLLYHAANYKNKEEALLVKGIFDWLQDEKEISTTDFKVEFIHPEKRVINLKSRANGVLFREVHFPKWRSYFEKDGGRKKLPIYTAGPDFMYIPLSGVETGGSLILEYKKVSVDWIAVFVSLTTFFVLILWLFDWWIFKSWVVSFTRKITSPIKGVTKWWESEDE